MDNAARQFFKVGVLANGGVVFDVIGQMIAVCRAVKRRRWRTLAPRRTPGCTTAALAPFTRAIVKDADEITRNHVHRRRQVLGTHHVAWFLRSQP